MSRETDPWVAVGIVLRPHALGGALVVKPLTRSAEEFVEAPLKTVTLRRRGEILGEYTIKSRIFHSGVPIIRFEGINDRNAAETIAGTEILIPEDQRWPLEEGQYYLDDLAGIELLDAESGSPIAKTLRAEEGNAHDYLVFPHPENPKKEVMLPLIPQFVPEIDIKSRQARVTLPAGLLDL